LDEGDEIAAITNLDDQAEEETIVTEEINQSETGGEATSNADEASSEINPE
jgi:hypothetical protein